MTSAKNARRDVAAEVAQRFIDALENGTVPWSKPWSIDGVMPTSASTGAPYRGINAFVLALVGQAEGYASAYWLTFRQAKALGGSVRRGEHGTTVILWKPIRVHDRNSEDPDAKISVPLMRAFTVFNVAQCDGVTLPPRMRPVRHDVSAPQAMRDVIDGYEDGPTIVHRPSVAAFYEPAADRVTLPELGQFTDAPAYCGTALHELVHSTGHESRLDRFGKNGVPQHFGSERYAAEELVAEIGASMIASMRGIPVSFDNSAAYVASWLEALKNDRGLIVVAAQRAQRAVDRILSAEATADVDMRPSCGFTMVAA